MEEIKLQDLQDIVKKAGDIVMEIYDNRGFHVEIKNDKSPVTEADKASSAFLISSLNRLYPGVPVISEEADIPPYSTRKSWEYAWCVDPLDGTKEFISRNGQFCINVGLIEKGKTIFGIINNVIDREILWGGRDVAYGIVRDEETLPQETPDSVPENKLRIAVSRFHLIEWELRYINYLRSLGYDLELVPLGASSKQCMVAQGLVDICPKFAKCSEWDIAAGHAIVEAAGGLVINVDDGKELLYNKTEMLNPPFIMFNRRIHDSIKAGNKIFLQYGKGEKR